MRYVTKREFPTGLSLRVCILSCVVALCLSISVFALPS
jgi:hypothetical protein